MVGVWTRRLDRPWGWVRTMDYREAVRFCGLYPDQVRFTKPDDPNVELASFSDMDVAIEWLSTRAAKLIEKGLRPVGF